MMGRKGYGAEMKLKAKVMWVVGNHTDAHIANILGITRPGTICEWRKEEGWDREKELLQEAIDERVSHAISETISEMNTRHLKEYQLLQTKGVQALKRLDPQKASEAASILDTGVKGERLVRGEPTEVREVRMLMRTNIQVLEVVVADVLRALLESGKIDRRIAKQFADLFANQVNDAPFQYAVEGG